MKAFHCLHSAIIGQHHGTHWLNANECQAESERLFSHIQRYYANTHDLYGQYRLWTMLYWQPVYMAVSAVHLNHGIIDCSLIQQIRHGERIHGYVTTSLCFKPLVEKTDILIAKQSQNLKSALQQYFDVIEQFASYKPRHIWGLVADCIAMAMLQLQKQDKSISDQQILNWLKLWLSHMELTDGKGYWLTNLSRDEQSGLDLNRRTCCLYYLVDSTDICISCPKHKIKNGSSNLILKSAC